MGNGKHGWHHAWHKILNTLVQKHHKDNLAYPTSKLEKKQFFLQSNFFQDFDITCLSGSLQPLAATRSTGSHSQPLATTSSHSQPLAATRSHSSGGKWLQVAAPSEWPQVAASGRSSGRKWPLPASGRKWPQVAAPASSKRVAASGRKWPLSAISISTLKATSLIFLVNSSMFHMFHACTLNHHLLFASWTKLNPSYNWQNSQNLQSPTLVKLRFLSTIIMFVGEHLYIFWINHGKSSFF